MGFWFFHHLSNLIPYIKFTLFESLYCVQNNPILSNVTTGASFFYIYKIKSNKVQKTNSKENTRTEKKKKKKTHNVKSLQLPETHVKLTFTMLLGLVSSLRFLMLTVVFVTALYII